MELLCFELSGNRIGLKYYQSTEYSRYEDIGRCTASGSCTAQVSVILGVILRVILHVVLCVILHVITPTVILHILLLIV